MSRRRIFQIDLPEDEEIEAPAPAAPSRRAAARPGPMASAVRENADSLKQRRALEAEIRAENDALAHEHVRLKEQGLVLERIPLSAIDAEKLTRDRAEGPDPELEELVASIRDIGLSNPIRVEKHGERYELIQGWRRMMAFRTLHAETGDEAWATIPAAMSSSDDDLELSYRRMVDENLVRKDISFAEMAELARAYAADPKIECEDVDKAVAALFRSAGYQKRSYIRAFAQLMEMLEGRLAHAPSVPRNLGLAVRRRLSERPGELADLAQALDAAPGRDANEELAILRGFVAEEDMAHDPAPKPAAPRPAPRPRAGKTTFRMPRPDGEAKCTASNGRLELQGGTDFTAYDRQRLERAVAAFFKALDD